MGGQRGIDPLAGRVGVAVAGDPERALEVAGDLDVHARRDRAHGLAPLHAAARTAEVALIEPLRTLRLIHFAGWLAARHAENAFQQAFPWFNQARWWEEHILTLREQLAAIDEPALEWHP